MHFLDKNVYDVTAIPYEKKLEALLSTVLVGDEFAEKIRAAFAGYIFMSYRKKDRQYAQSLMRLIHKNEFCRDIAIWYDEFLVPGENFNDAIIRAIDKSDIFVMAVTPNLVSEENYILTIEYPMAQTTGKPILPIEMLETDHGKLFDKFQELPTLTNAQNEMEFNEMLNTTIRNLALMPNHSSPEHNFFIGLAYLDGIDVEVDYQRAYELIKASAEEGLREAIEKLINMYENGHGIERNYKTAIEWREKLIICSEQEYNTTHTEETLNKLFWDVIDCGSAYMSLGKGALAREKYEYAQKLIKDSGLIETSYEVLRNLSVCYSRLGAVSFAQEDNTAANQYYKEMLDINEKLFREVGTVQSRHDLAIAYRIMGIPGRTGIKAVEYREKGIAIAEELVKETGSLSSRQLLLDAYMYHGVLLKVSGRNNLPIAQGFYEKALVLAENMNNEFATLQTLRNLSNIYGLLSGIYESLGDKESVMSFREKCLHIHEDLVNKTDSVQDRSSLAGDYIRKAIEYEKSENFINSVMYYKKAIEIRERLVAETDALTYVKDLYRAYDSLAKSYEKSNKLLDAYNCYKRKVEICDEWINKTNSSEAYDELARAYCSLDSITSGNEYLLQALKIYEFLCQKYPDKPYYKQRYDTILSCLNY